MEFWGTVSDIFKKDGPEQLPAEDDSKVVRLATAMLIFFIVCIILLIVYLLCRWTAILTSASKSSIRRFVITEKASWLKAANYRFHIYDTIKTLC